MGLELGVDTVCSSCAGFQCSCRRTGSTSGREVPMLLLLLVVPAPVVELELEVEVDVDITSVVRAAVAVVVTEAVPGMH